ncbi:MAG: acyl-CoA dehydrogenase, partial [Bacteroidia bacterium]|nr:acyl-CoA dehydrogenase [Bacteroidia bacterium]
MNIFSSKKLEQFLPQFKSILEDYVYPLERKYLNLPFSNVEAELNKIRTHVKAKGLWNPHLSENHGGMGFNLVEFGQISELLGTSPYGHYCFNCNAPDIGNQELLLGNASDYIK